MLFKVLDIFEDIDFGCEERSASPVMAVVSLESSSGEVFTQKFEDARLYAEDIQPGDLVRIKDGQLCKVSDKD